MICSLGFGDAGGAGVQMMRISNCKCLMGDRDTGRSLEMDQSSNVDMSQEW